MPGVSRHHVAIVGGGISGLAAAWRLTRLAPDVAVTVFERDQRLGGKIVTHRIDGFTIEGGPDSFLSVKPRGVGLCQELGLSESLQGTVEANRRTFVMKQGMLYPLPEGLTGLIPSRLGPIARSDLLSPLGKARLAMDFIIPPRRSAGDEPLAAFIQRRLGGEVYARLIEPLMAGIYAGDGRQLSLMATFPQLREAERRHGGLIRGVLAARRNAPTASPGPGFLTPRDGTGAIVAALEHRLRDAGVQVRPRREITGLEPAETGYRLTISGKEQASFEAVILATPAWATAKLVRPIDAEAARALAAIPHVSSATISLGYRADDLTRLPDGYGYVVPRVERRPVLACTWTSNKWARRAPEGHILMRAFVGRAGQPDPLDSSDDELIEAAREEFRDVLGLTAEPVVSLVSRWPMGMPQYTMGHLDRVALATSRLAASPTLALAGNGYHGVGIPDCIASGERAAESVLAALGIERRTTPPAT
jgi:oxygen-dependent protoporphyrinogen oxidase